MTGLAWQERAACRGADPHLFFPDIPAGRQFRPVVADTARRYCHGCPVLQQCDTWAETTLSVGLWASVWRRYRGSQYTRSPVLAGHYGDAS